LRQERWERLKELFADALEKSIAERGSFLREACAGEEELLEDVLNLLEEHERSGEFMRPRWLPELEDFEIVREIGSGGMGVVYLARQHSLDRLVAVKVMRNHLGSTPAQVLEFRKEPAKAASLKHPSIVPIHMVGPEDEVPYFVMDYIPGKSLGHVIADCRAPRSPVDEITSTHVLGGSGAKSYAAQVARVVLGIAEALEYAHSQGLVHRDIKPGNILIDGAGHPHLVDFGLAKLLDSKTLTSRVMGTPFYMSPEQAHLRDIKVDHRTDIYSLGVVLYEMLTLRRPFERESYTQVFEAIQEFDPPSVRDVNPSVPIDLQTICGKAMRKDASRRYQSAGEFAEDLRRFLEHKPPLARPESWFERAQRRFSRNRTKVLWAASLLFAVTLAFVVNHVQAEGRKPRFDLHTNPEGAEVWAVRLDEVSGLPAAGVERQRLGTSNIESMTIEPGYYRIEAQLDDSHAGELVHWFPKEARLHELPTLELRDGPEVTAGMVRIEAGTFVAHERTGDRPAVEGPIDLHGYWIDTHEVTNLEYRRFIESTGYKKPYGWPEDWKTGWQSAWDSLPVAFVTFYDAEHYAAWAGKRLPIELEWRRAAGGANDAPWPWGGPDEVPADIEERASLIENPTTEVGTEPTERWKHYLENMAAVGTHPGSNTPLGVQDMLGNVQEWTQGLEHSEVEDGVWTTADNMRPVYGGSIGYRGGNIRFNYPIHASAVDYWTGIRCVKSIHPQP